jgi:hypothetical protein
MPARVRCQLIAATVIWGLSLTACGEKKPAANEGCTDAANAAKDYQAFRQDYFVSPPNLPAAKTDRQHLISDAQQTKSAAESAGRTGLSADAAETASDAQRALNDINAGLPVSTALISDLSALGNDCSGTDLFLPTSPMTPAAN